MKKHLKLTYDGQIKHLKNRGIKFEKISGEKAMDFLKDNTYYFKIKAFNKNYDKDTKGKYVNLDFAYLQELSTLDMHLRKTVLLMSLNLEHSLKVRLNRIFTKNNDEDGYAIVCDFLKSNPFVGNHIEKSRKSATPYNYDLKSRYKETKDIAIWNLSEMLTFGDFINFYKFCFERWGLGKEEKVLKLLLPIKDLRNAAAHNNCILNNLRRNFRTEETERRATKTVEPSKYVSSLLTKVKTISNVSRKRKIRVPVTHDFSALMFAFDMVVESKAIKHHAYLELKKLIERLDKNAEYFEKNTAISSTFLFLKKVVDYFGFFEYTNSIEQKL